MQPDLQREGYAILIRCCDLSAETPLGDFYSTIVTLDRILRAQIESPEDFFPSPYGGAIYLSHIDKALAAAQALAGGLATS